MQAGITLEPMEVFAENLIYTQKDGPDNPIRISFPNLLRYTQSVLIAEDGTSHYGSDQITQTGLYQTNDKSQWYYLGVTEATQTQVLLETKYDEIVLSEDDFGISLNKTQPFLLKIYRADSNGNKVSSTNEQFDVNLSGLDIFKLDY